MPLPRPSWLRAPAPAGHNYRELKDLITRLDLHTVCESAACPNVVVAHPAGVIQGVDQLFTGQIERIDTAFLQSLLDQGVVPVVPPLGCDVRRMCRSERLLPGSVPGSEGAPGAVAPCPAAPMGSRVADALAGAPAGEAAGEAAKSAAGIVSRSLSVMLTCER